MPQIYATVYDNTSVLVFTKNTHARFFQKNAIPPPRPALNGGGKCCFPGGGIQAADFGGEWPQHRTPAQWAAARIAGARREFLEETGYTLPAAPTVSFTNPQNASCHFFPLPAGMTLAQVQAQIADQLALANGAGWQHAHAAETLHVVDNELASVAIVPWANLPNASFPADDHDVDWFCGFVTDMKQHLNIP